MTSAIALTGGLITSSAVASAVTARSAGITYRSASDGFWWELGPDGTPVKAAGGLAVAAGTSPAEAGLSTGGRIIVFHSSATDTVWWVGTDGTAHDTNVPIAAGTSPAIAGASTDGYWAAIWQGGDGHLWFMDNGGPFSYGFTMKPGTSPSIAFMSTGGAKMTWVGADGTVWIADASGENSIHVSTTVKATSNPTVATVGDYWMLVFRGDNGHLWSMDSTGFFWDMGQTIRPGSGPAVAASATTGMKISFVAPDNTLWTINGSGENAAGTGLPVAANTSPAMASDGSNWTIVFQQANHHLVTVNSAIGTIDTHLLVAAGDGPGIAAALTGQIPALPSDPGMASASLTSVQVSGASVTVNWTDNSTNEDLFRVLRRDASSGVLQNINERNTVDKAGTGGTYSYVDTITVGAAECYEILDLNSLGASNYSNEVCTIGPAVPAAPAAGQGIISLPDQTTGTGTRSSVALGPDGDPVVSYFASDPAGGKLRVSHCSDVSCASATATTLATASFSGLYSSLKIGSDGLPLISYVTTQTGSPPATVNDLYVVHCTNAQCSSSTNSLIDGAANVDNQTSLGIGKDGRGIIAYFDDRANGPDALNIAHCANVQCSSASTRVIDTVGPNPTGDNHGQATAAVAVNPTTGMVYVVYYDGLGNDIKVIACTDPDCTTIASQASVDIDAAGPSPSVAVGLDGLPLISYAHGGNSLAVAHCVNLYCTAVTKTTIGGTSPYGAYGSIAIGADGFGVVSFTDVANKNVEVAHCSDLTCTALTHVVIDEFDNLGMDGTSIAIGSDGLPIVSYYDGDNQILKVAHCGDAACASEMIAPF